MNEFASLNGAGVTFNANVNGSTAAFAAGVLTLTGNVEDGETLTVGNNVYTGQATLTNVANNVHIGVSAETSIDNFVDAFNLGTGAGTDYAAATLLNRHVVGSKSAADEFTVTAKIAGTAAHAIATSTDIEDGTWGAEFLEGGVDPVYFRIGTGKSMTVNGLIIFIRDATVADGTFGAITALTNGVTIHVKRGDTIVADLTGGIPLTINRDFYRIAPKVEKDSGGTWIQAFIPFDGGISLPSGTDIVISIQDDLTGLDEFYIYATGV